MIKNGMTDYLCYLPYDFTDPKFIEFDTHMLDCGMGVESEDIFGYALDIVLDVATLDDIVNYLDTILFPEHVPNEYSTPYISLCIKYIFHFTKDLYQYRRYIYLLVHDATNIKFNKITSTVEVRFKI